MIDLEMEIKEKLKDIDLVGIVREEIAIIVGKESSGFIKQYIKEKCNNLVDKNIEVILSEGIETDDGWGEKKKFLSFNDLFKQELKKRMKDSYEFNRVVERKVSEKITALMNKEYTAVVDKIISALIDSKS